MQKSEMPLTESLQDTIKRILPLWHDNIAPAIKSGQKVLIVAHGNSIRVSAASQLHITITHHNYTSQFITITKATNSCILMLHNLHSTNLTT